MCFEICSCLIFSSLGTKVKYVVLFLFSYEKLITTYFEVHQLEPFRDGTLEHLERLGVWRSEVVTLLLVTLCGHYAEE